VSVPIIPPVLDDRRFDDLVEELLARIPAHTPEWTHPRQGDPGRTLIELFAWLADTLLYRANLIPERQRLVFLRLLGQQLRPAQPGRAVVSLSYAQEDTLVATRLAPGGRVAGPVPFETLSETTVLPIGAEAYYKRSLSDTESAKMADVLQGLSSIHRLAGAPRGYETAPLFGQGRASTARVDVFSTSADHALWLALLAPAAPDVARQPAFNEAARAQLGGGDTGAPALLSVGLVPALRIPELFENVGPRARVPVLWEITTRGRGSQETSYLTLDPFPESDTTAGLTRAGVLRLPLPDESLIWAPSNDVGENPRAGVGDSPPRLDDPEKAARLIAWLRLRPAPGQPDVKLELSWIGINAVAIEQRVTLAGRVLGASSGAADQLFSLPMGSVDPDTLQIQVEEQGRGYQPWQRVEDLAAISGDPQVARMAPAYELDAEAGTLRFGDGVRGRIPEQQMRVRLALGRFGGGRAGNLPAGALTEVSARRVEGGNAPPLKVAQPLPTEGGDDAETAAEAEKRIPTRLRHRDRAVTTEDYRRLALETPGVEVGRVELLPRFKPRDRRFDVPGVVSVMALPARALSGPPNPRPDRPFIETLHAYLSARVPLTTELYVIGCEYVPLGVAVGITVRDGFGPDQVRHEVRQTLERLLWPLVGGGVDGEGWPLGRAVRDRELEVEVSRVRGVREVTGLNLFGRAHLPGGDDWRAVTRDPGDGTQSLTLTPWQLPELLSVVVAAGAVPTDLRAVPNPFADERAVAVPVVPEVC
jgi:predicted phage baseplate assembly protein